MKVKYKECFAYTEAYANKCSATLNETCEKCPFFATKEQYQDDQIKARIAVEKKYGKDFCYEQFARERGISG